jgi:8-oxo-dGTP pyrophosphatase MutT (NUDIX family)
VSPNRRARRNAVRILGVTEDGRVEFDAPLRHGDDPDLVAYDHGFLAVRPVDARRDRASGRLQVRLRVQPLNGEPRPRSRGRGQDPDLMLTPGVEPEVRQRVAAYAVVLSDRGLLATEYSDRTAVSGRWGMPGGGLDDGEEPTDAVLREVHEETAQTVQVGELVRVQTSHWIGQSPHRTVQDFHAVRLIYRAHCPAPTDAEVLDTGGTTESARWVPIPDWQRLHWTANWQWILAELLATAQSDG